MKNKIYLGIPVLIATLLIAYIVYLKMSIPKIVYVRSLVLVEKYQGMKEAKNKYQTKIDGWQMQVDSLEKNFKMELNKYQIEVLSKNKKDKIREMKLREQKAEFDQVSQNLNEKAENENEILMQGALNQINDYIEKYSKENGYDLVLGITSAGNILYGTDKLDITDVVLEGINKDYNGK